MMAEAIHLTILSPFGVLYDEDVDEVYVPAKKGPLGVLKGHTPFIAELSENGGTLRFKRGAANSYVHLSHGIAEIKPDRLVILTGEGRFLSEEEVKIAA